MKATVLPEKVWALMRVLGVCVFALRKATYSVWRGLRRHFDDFCDTVVLCEDRMLLAVFSSSTCSPWRSSARMVGRLRFWCNTVAKFAYPKRQLQTKRFPKFLFFFRVRGEVPCFLEVHVKHASNGRIFSCARVTILA